MLSLIFLLISSNTLTTLFCICSRSSQSQSPPHNFFAPAMSINLLNVCRARVRQSLSLDPSVPPWWQRRGAPQSALQLAFAASLFGIVVGLPLSWNATVAAKWEAYRASRDARDARDAAAASAVPFDTLAREALLAELIINERRAARGAAPIDWAARRPTEPAAAAAAVVAAALPARAA
jgi:hypothetical protein